jgi:zinc finger protein
VPKKKPAAGPKGPEPQVSGPRPLGIEDVPAIYLEAPCPVCASPKSALRTITLDIPYFGEVFESVFLCPACGFKHADTLIPRIGEPAEFSLRVSKEEDMFVRAVKSSSATVEIPELGLLWEPGPASLSEVTNVEGLLRRFDDAVGRAQVLFGTKQAKAKGDQIRAKIAAVIDGKGVLTVLLKDPYGNSALIDPSGRVKRRVMSPQEAREMPTGEYLLEMGDNGTPSSVRRADP